MWNLNSILNIFWLWNNTHSEFIEELENQNDEIIFPKEDEKTEKHRKRLLRYLKNSDDVDILIKLWHELSPKEYEYFIAYVFNKVLWYTTFVTWWFNDWGIDIKWGRKVDWKLEYIAIQCKRWNTFNVKEKDIKQFYASVVDIKYKHWIKLFFATTNYLTRNASVLTDKYDIHFLDYTVMIEAYKMIDWSDFLVFLDEKKLIDKELQDNKSKKKIHIKVNSNKNLFILLKEVRKKLAKEYNLPAYCIFKDDTLNEIVKKKPITKRDFLMIDWIWEAKYNKYCHKFSEVIKNNS